MSSRVEQLEEIYARIADLRTALWLRIREAVTVGDKARTDIATLDTLDNQALNLAYRICDAYDDGGSDDPRF